MAEMMNAWRVHNYGPFRESLLWEQCEAPKASGGAAVMRVKAVGLNFADMLSMEGKYQVQVPPPFVPGMEAAGEIIAVGEDSTLKVGQRVMATNLSGSLAEQMLVLDQACFPIPDAMSDREAAAFHITYQTSYFGLAYRAKLQAGEVLLVHAGAGGVGTAAIQIGKAMGATVIATAGSAQKLEICEQAGADHVINYRKEDFVKQVKSITGGAGANVVYDPVGGDVFTQSTRCIAWEGRIVVIGFASGNIPEIAANRILLKNMAVVGLYWGNYQFQNPALIAETHDKLCALYAEGKVKPILYKKYMLPQLPEGLVALEGRQSYGKIVLGVK